MKSAAARARLARAASCPGGSVRYSKGNVLRAESEAAPRRRSRIHSTGPADGACGDRTYPNPLQDRPGTGLNAGGSAAIDGNRRKVGRRHDRGETAAVCLVVKGGPVYRAPRSRHGGRFAPSVPATRVGTRRTNRRIKLERIIQNERRSMACMLFASTYE